MALTSLSHLPDNPHYEVIGEIRIDQLKTGVAYLLESSLSGNAVIGIYRGITASGGREFRTYETDGLWRGTLIDDHLLGVSIFEIEVDEGFLQDTPMANMAMNPSLQAGPFGLAARAKWFRDGCL